MQEVRVGLVGLGAAARGVMREFNVVDGAEFAAACDVREDELERFHKRFGVETFNDFEALCKSDVVDAVWLCTPNNLHAQHAIIAAEHGKHVICEKPMAITMDEANRMCEAVERNGVKYVQGHSKIYTTFAPAMGKIIESGVIGKVIQITIMTYKDWMQRPWESHTLDPKRGGGVVYRQGPHQMDLVRYLAGGMAKSVRAIVGGAHPTINVHGHHTAFFEFENDVAALVNFNGYANFDTSEFTWNMGEGPGARPDEERHIPRPRATGPIPIEEFYKLPEYNLDRPEGEGRRPRDPKITQQNFFGLMIVSCEQGDLRQHPEGIYLYKDGARELIPVPDRPGGELRELVECINEDRPAFPDHNWGRATLETCIGMIESSRQRKEIELKYQCPSPVKMPDPLKKDTTDYYATNIL